MRRSRRARTRHRNTYVQWSRSHSQRRPALAAGVFVSERVFCRRGEAAGARSLGSADSTLIIVDSPRHCCNEHFTFYIARITDCRILALQYFLTNVIKWEKMRMKLDRWSERCVSFPGRRAALPWRRLGRPAQPAASRLLLRFTPRSGSPMASPLHSSFSRERCSIIDTRERELEAKLIRLLSTDRDYAFYYLFLLKILKRELVIRAKSLRFP